MTDEQRKNLFMVCGGIAIGVVGGYFIGKVVGSNIATDTFMRKLAILAEAAKASGKEFPLRLSYAKTGTDFLCKVVPEVTEEFTDLVQAF